MKMTAPNYCTESYCTGYVDYAPTSNPAAQLLSMSWSSVIKK